MNETLEVFESKKRQSHELLSRLQAFLSQGEEAGAYIDPSLKNKLDSTLKNLNEEKLKIALVGGFSEGKTSIAAAWMEKLDKTTMKISHEESSDEVKVYPLDDDCVLIDTPGLFGFKEKISSDTQAIEKYKEITKKYVSEAHLILYVMNSQNPIKASHKEDLEWLFRTLNLLPRTVFVLSRFDEIADVEDDWDYREHLKIKQQNVFSRLDDTIQLEEKERAGLAVVAVSANPFGMGTEYWLENIDKFKAMSHIKTLQQATSQKVRNSGGLLTIAEEARNSIIRDILTKQMPPAKEADRMIGEELRRLEDLQSYHEEQLKMSHSQIREVKIELRYFLSNYFADLILQAKGLDMNTFSDFFEREVGDEGIMIETRIKNEFDSRISSVNDGLGNLNANLEKDVSHYNSTVTMLGKQGVNYVIKSNMINNKTVLAARDGVVSVAKVVGLDLEKMLKFHPWGAVNLAKGLNGILAFAGIAFEAWDSWAAHKKAIEFQSLASKMDENFNQQRKELLALIDAKDFFEIFFPDYVVMEKKLAALADCNDELRLKRDKFAQWVQVGQRISQNANLLN
ncbi:hypothetical protein DSLASN_30590 [Desulfoluna limicola]|uniref:Labile enterotoxin output A n=1 Tax=Desulfoluna limicola TaxID=2810562 RepID=A0ABN6F7B2_9BACT|nr:LeoA/HP0731 family dynamin-like GTPase [Desulfoluna limicola]BCS97427.1 hypothetical protein DSLASN_30590 [Desulfoluna limicola]